MFSRILKAIGLTRARTYKGNKKGKQTKNRGKQTRKKNLKRKMKGG